MYQLFRRLKHSFAVQNNALAPLWSPEVGINNSPVNAEWVVFVTDVHFCPYDIVRLLQHDADIVCGLDLYAAHGNNARPDAWNSTYSQLWCAQTVRAAALQHCAAKRQCWGDCSRSAKCTSLVASRDDHQPLLMGSRLLAGFAGNSGQMVCTPSMSSTFELFAFCSFATLATAIVQSGREGAEVIRAVPARGEGPNGPLSALWRRHTHAGTAAECICKQVQAAVSTEECCTAQL